MRVMPDALEIDDGLAARDPVLARLAAAAVAGLPPAGPAERKREPVTIGNGGQLEIVGELVVQDQGFNLHAKTRAGAVDEEARSRLLRYVLRPPLAQERLKMLPDHRVRLFLKRAWSDGTYALDMDALALLARLASSVPPPKQHLTRYSGVLSAASHWRPLIVPPPPGQAPVPSPPDRALAPPAFTKPAKPPRSGLRCRYIRFAELMRLTFGLQVDQCPACGGRMKLRALVRDPESIERFLRHQGLWSEPCAPAPARAPPYQRAVTRLVPTRQQELFADT